MASPAAARGGDPLVLGIETSCDETGVALVRGRELLVDTVASSMDEHARYGGIIPEVASRAHLEAMIPTLERSLGTADARSDSDEWMPRCAAPPSSPVRCRPRRGCPRSCR